jgi:3-keto-5-aminohexanoate cleavage enzyme
MVSATPVIVEIALNGAVAPGRNPHLPVTVSELVDDALACLAAGASIVHQHDPIGGGSGPASERLAALGAQMYRAVLQKAPDAILYPTADFGAWPDGVAMWSHHERLAAEGLLRMAVWDPGAVMLGRADVQGVPATGIIYGYDPEAVAHIARRCQELALAPNVSVFEPGFLRTTLAYHRAGRLPPGAFVKLYFGPPRRPFGLPPTPASLETYLQLMGPDADTLPWAVAVPGGDVVACGLAEAAIRRGGHIRVGLEDYAGPRTPSNPELLEEVRELAALHGRALATPAQAAQILGIP